MLLSDLMTYKVCTMLFHFFSLTLVCLYKLTLLLIILSQGDRNQF